MAENGQDNADLLKHTAGSRPSSAARGGTSGTCTMHWFAYVGPDPPVLDEEDREARLRNLKERQNEERQKKLEEIKAQALAAQRYKEQKEQERRQRFEELRQREDSRRQQVEERKRAINEAERDRLESILRRNQEREARIEARKRNDRHSIVFAFGSSTPRMLEPAADSTSYGSFWGQRRATSTQNITSASSAAAMTTSGTALTRRQSERELDAGSKKRATSAGGLERSIEDSQRMSSSMYEIFGYEGGPGGAVHSTRLMRSSSANFGTPPTTPAGCVSGYVGRRRTDLMPTIPLKDPSSGSNGLAATGGGSARSKSFARSPAPSRPSSALSQQSTTSVTSSVNMRMRPIAAPRRPRPASIAVTGVTSSPMADKNGDKSTRPPLPKSRKPSIGKSQEKLKRRPSTAAPAASAGTSAVASPTEPAAKPLVPDAIAPAEPSSTIVTEVDTKSKVDNIESNTQQITQLTSTELNKLNGTPPPEVTESTKMSAVVETNEATPASTPASENPAVQEAASSVEPIVAGDSESTMTTSEMADMTASMTKVRITTEEEAKAALAERRRLAREEAERQAEAERLRIEEENRLEMERQQREEEQQRVLIEQMRAAEQERLEEAIREAQKREEEERARKEEEARQKVIREEIERKAREEAERQKIEAQERAKAEEIERQARRKRVEAIMQRTRGKNNSSTPQQTDEKNEENSSDTMNGSKSENGHKNGKEMLDTVAPHVDNIIPVESLKNANTVNVSETTTLSSTDDTLNSNNAWQRNNQTTDLLM